ncbi:MAG TPA: hypothetical protein VKU89_10550 [Solirubrobacteraceae bacterium]|nr:hypothetical protein [Solirubrobacteraceae bacterium]
MFKSTTSTTPRTTAGAAIGSSWRRALCALALSALVPLGLPALASAAPTVEAHARILPIPHFAHTGNILGAGAELETTFKITGSEYDFGHPAPLRRVEVFFPKGTKITTKGFPSACTAAMLERGGAAACKKEQAGPPGSSNGVVNIGGEPIPETVTVTPFFTSNGLLFWIEGSTPTKIEKVAVGHWTQAGAPYGPEIVVEVPLIETLPGAPDASAELIKSIAGAARRVGRKTIYYGTIPKSCPKGGFPGKAVLSFGAGAESTWESATALVKVPCPTHALKGGRVVAVKHGVNRRAALRHASARRATRRSSSGLKRRVRRHKIVKSHRGKAKGHAKKHGKGKAKGHSKGPSSAY